MKQTNFDSVNVFTLKHHSNLGREKNRLYGSSFELRIMFQCKAWKTYILVLHFWSTGLVLSWSVSFRLYICLVDGSYGPPFSDLTIEQMVETALTALPICTLSILLSNSNIEITVSSSVPWEVWRTIVLWRHGSLSAWDDVPSLRTDAFKLGILPKNWNFMLEISCVVALVTCRYVLWMDNQSSIRLCVLSHSTFNSWALTAR